MRSIDYFRDVLNAALNYFGRKPPKPRNAVPVQSAAENASDDNDLIEVVTVDESDVSTKEPAESLHNSYRLFYKRFPVNVARDFTIRQDRIRYHFKQMFDEKDVAAWQGVLKVTSSTNPSNSSDQIDIQEAFQPDPEMDFEAMEDNDDDQNETDAHLLERITSNLDEDEEENLMENLEAAHIDDNEQTS